MEKACTHSRVLGKGRGFDSHRLHILEFVLEISRALRAVRFVSAKYFHGVLNVTVIRDPAE